LLTEAIDIAAVGGFYLGEEWSPGECIPHRIRIDTWGVAKKPVAEAAAVNAASDGKDGVSGISTAAR
jgi:hypothetical protein